MCIRDRREALLIGGIAAAFLLFEASYEYPFGGNSPGPRQLIPILPFMALPLAICYRRFPVTTLALGVPSAVLMLAATVTHPMNDFAGQWFQRIGDGDFSATVLGLFGSMPLDNRHLPYSTTWHPLLLFLSLVVLALACTIAERPQIRVSLRDVLSGATCFLGWFVIQREAPMWLASNGFGRQWGPIAVVLLVIAVAAIPVALFYLLRRSPGPLVEPNLSGE